MPQQTSLNPVLFDEAQTSAEQTGKQRIAASAQLLRMRVRFFSSEPGDWSDATLRTAEKAIPLFEAHGAHSELGERGGSLVWCMASQQNTVNPRMQSVIR